MKKVLIILLTTFMVQAIAESTYPTSEDLRHKYPSIDDGSDRPEKKEILCPFWRLIERSGSLDMLDKTRNSDVVVSIRNISRKAREFGCKYFECASVASLVSAGQKTYPGVTKLFHVNISKLHKARGISHECGLTFEKGGSKVSDAKRAQTLSRLKAIADENQGRLVLADIQKIKLQICEEQNVKITDAGALEVKLIFSFLGGNDRGFIEYTDVERFFHAKMPLTKAIDSI